MLAFTEALQRYLGISAFRGQQRSVIDEIAAGRDVICTFPTGYGKSVCYCVPALAAQQLILVISPLISLIQDQVSKLNTHARVAFNLSGSCSTEVSDEACVFASDADVDGPMLLFATPEKLESETFRENLRRLHARKPFAYFVIDEAHLLGEQGFDFRSAWLNLGVLRSTFPDAATACFSATCNEFGKRALTNVLRLHSPVLISEIDTKPNLSLSFHYTAKHQRQCSCRRSSCTWGLAQSSAGFHVHISLLERLRQLHGGETLVVTNSRKDCEAVCAALVRLLPDRKVAFYHGQLEDSARADVQQRFVHGDIDVLCATMSSFGTGVNMPRLIKVVIYGIPLSVYSFIQTMGRGGRAGQEYEVDVFLREADVAKQRAVMQGEVKKLAQKKRYAEHVRSSFVQMMAIFKVAVEGKRCLLAFVNQLLSDPGQELDVPFADLAEFKRANNRVPSAHRAVWDGARRKWWLPPNAFHSLLQKYGAVQPEALPKCNKCSCCVAGSRGV